MITLLITSEDDAAETSFSCGFQAVLRVRVPCPPPIEKRLVWQDRSFSFLSFSFLRMQVGLGLVRAWASADGSVNRPAASFILQTSARSSGCPHQQDPVSSSSVMVLPEG